MFGIKKKKDDKSTSELWKKECQRLEKQNKDLLLKIDQYEEKLQLIYDYKNKYEELIHETNKLKQHYERVTNDADKLANEYKRKLEKLIGEVSNNK